eukprot:NODE_91_length_21557_cov_0.766660.p14 type:complete len:173 gc:universal NODE_91_length_21557_cov_0.766660:13106-12588(-)
MLGVVEKSAVHSLNFKCICGTQNKDQSRYTRHYRKCHHVSALDKLILNLKSHKNFKSSSMKTQFPPNITWDRTLLDKDKIDSIECREKVKQLWNFKDQCPCGHMITTSSYDTLKHVYVCPEHSWDEKVNLMESLKVRNFRKRIRFPKPSEANKLRKPTIKRVYQKELFKLKP